MLREWTEMGYVTRDYVNFAVPYVVAAKPRVVRSTADNVINVSFAGKSDGSSVPSDGGSGAPPKVGVAEPAPIDPVKSSSHAAASLNEATIEEIAAVKGVSKKVAGNLVAARPFKSFDDLLEVKGIGKAMIKKLRQLFAL
jgi:DNA uptake protein ComE-like DNA-binding protein